MQFPRRALLIIPALALVATACSSGGRSAPSSVTSSPSPMVMPSRQTMPPETAGSNGTMAFGKPGEPSAGDRVIKIDQLDTLRFDPSRIHVKVGDTVMFQITNRGAVTHEFVLGDRPFQTAHERAMTAMNGEMPVDEANSVSIQAGFTKTVVWTFTSRGKVLFGCHMPGHYAGGMVGTVVVT